MTIMDPSHPQIISAVKQIAVKEMPSEITLAKPVTFLIEASNAGPGNLEVIVNNGKVPSTPQALGPNLFAITFVPEENEPHVVEITFNGEMIQGAPFVCSVIDPSKWTIRKEGLDRVPVHSVATLAIETHGNQLSEQNVSIVGPNQQRVEATVMGDATVGYIVSFTPHEVGDHAIDIKVFGDSVPSCPFLVKVYDAKNVRVSDMMDGSVGKPVFFSIDASQAGAGNLEIIVSVNGRNVPNYVQSEGNAKFRVNFKPTEVNSHTVSVKFNGEPVPGSPYVVNITDNAQTVMTGQSLKMAPLLKKLEFTIENKSDAKECKVVVTSPSNKKVKASIVNSGSAFNISFVPVEVGPHQVVVLLDGVVLSGCPVSCNVYDVSKVKVANLTTGSIGKPLTFEVDASQAGEGTLELVVTTRKSSVRAEILVRSRGMYDVTFVPQEKVSHYVNITFNEEDVPGSPYKIDVKDVSAADGSLKRKMNGQAGQEAKSGNGLIGKPNIVRLDWPFSPSETEFFEVKVTGPHGSAIPAVGRIDNSKLIIEFTPRDIGLYKVESYNKGSLALDRPHYIEVCDPSRVKLVNVQDGVVGREQTFKIDCTRAGRGEMSLSIVAGDKDVRHIVKEISGGVQQVTYVPFIDLPHYIDVKYSGYHAPGCPQMVEIRDPSQCIIVHGPALTNCSPGQGATFLIETGGFAAAKDFDVIVADPVGSPLPVKCYQQKDGSLLAEYFPSRTGAHKIDVLYLDNPVSGSPFTSESFDASRVILQKIKSTNFTVNEKIAFTLNRRDAGYAELDVTVTSPLGRHLPIEVKGTPDGEGELIEFIPSVPGKYKIAITFGGVEVTGSPVTFVAHDGDLPSVEGKGLKFGHVTEPAVFVINAKGIFGKPEVRVEGPETEPEVTMKEDNGFITVSYIPEEAGNFDVHILWNGRELTGSPFHPQIINLNNVRPIGGWENLTGENGRLELLPNEEKKISFDVLGAGPGKLRATIKQPNGHVNDARVEQTGSSKYKLSITPLVEGTYEISLYFADHLVPKSPFKCIANEPASNSECATVVLRGHGLAGARVGEETEFIIDGNEAGNGKPDITLTGMKADIPVKVSQVSAKLYKANYTPSVQGTYLLNVLWAGKQVKGCPLKVTIMPRCDSSRVICTGDGLKHGVVGKEIKAFIDTKRAGPGELTAHCIGPQKVAYCELYDQMDGTFVLFLKPQEGGRHILTVKYGGEHVTGSPFTVKVAGAPDASKVRVYGPGIEHGVLPLYQSRFICDTRGAGAGQLTVRVRGPKGAFRVEMQRESQKDRTILCKYDPTEPGDYRIEVKWSGEHVPGSPFAVMIFDTQDELNRFATNQSRNSSSPVSSRNGPGPRPWRGSTNEL
ncbi:Filamin-A [Halotydeus destructor]|nr:Filamin-A [Halotydeus destructor]